MKVVAVDDDVVVHMALTMSWDDVEVIECTRATGAFTVGVAHHPDAFVIDRRLPDGDGLALVRRLRRDLRTNQLAIVVLTAAFDPADEAEVLKSGADAYLAKPFEPAELLRVIERLVALPPAQRRPRRQRSVELLHDGIAPEPLIDLTDGALGTLDWRVEAMRHGRESDRGRRLFRRRGADAVAKH
jgi:DNA-binding response OmpR family regulator